MGGTTFDIEIIAAADLGVRTCLDGAIVYAKGDPGDCAYIVRRGKIELRSAAGPIEAMQPGEIFGEMDLLDGQPRACWAVARGVTEVLPISPWIFEQLLSDDPEFAQTVTRLMVRRLRAAFAQLEGPSERLLVLPSNPAPRFSA